jgi:membrane protease YdiL (CAAX protease family)
MTDATTTNAKSDAWRAGAIWTVGLLALPPVLTIIVFRVGAAAGVSFAPLQPIVAGFLVYGMAAALAAVVLWLWARERDLVRTIFDFKPLAGPDSLVVLAGLLAGLFVLYPASQWIARLLVGMEMGGASYGRETPFAIPIMAISAVVIAPFCEEVLFRGLGVAYLKQLRWPEPAVWLTVTLAFAAIHLPNFGLAGSVFMVLWGGMVTAIRQWRGSLTPGLIVHFLNNAAAYLVFPLLAPAG